MLDLRASEAMKPAQSGKYCKQSCCIFLKSKDKLVVALRRIKLSIKYICSDITSFNLKQSSSLQMHYTMPHVSRQLCDTQLGNICLEAVPFVLVPETIAKA